MAYAIEKDVPCPPRQGRTACPAARDYPFAQMEVGDSFSVPLSERCVVAFLTRRYARHTGTKFTSRQDAATQTVRVWRLA